MFQTTEQAKIKSEQWVSFLVTEGDSLMFLFDKKSLNGPFVLFYLTLSSLSFIILTYSSDSAIKQCLLWCVNCNALNKFTGPCLGDNTAGKTESYCSCCTVQLWLRNLCIFPSVSDLKCIMHQKYIDKLITKCEKYLKNMLLFVM